MEILGNSQVEAFLVKIQEYIGNKDYKKIVLQLNRELLPISFDLVSKLKKKYNQRQFFVLYDSLKQPCCIDALGAQHVNYDCLIHFGRACFSSPHLLNHYYIFPPGEPTREQQIKQLLNSPEMIESINVNQIGYLLVDQPYYELVKNEISTKKLNLEILRLAPDAQEEDKYMIFGYYSSHVKEQLSNLLVITDINSEESSEMGFIEKIAFTLKSLNTKLGQKLFALGDNEGEPIVQQKINNMKRLMQRYSIISQLENHDIFGVLVSNTGTSFVNQSVLRCQQILKKHNKKCFLFMMNNLNEVKLGNFAEIQVYVIVSCHNHSLFSVKDFHQLIVTPTDLEIAFEKRNFDEYGFDLKAEVNSKQPIQLPTEIEEGSSTEIEKAHSQQVALQSKIQALTFYREREYKGLEFSEKKEVKKMTKGKIGLAQQYTNLQ